MVKKKTLAQREQELQALLKTPEGQKELQELEHRYRDASGRPRAGKASIITYLIVQERQKGLICA